MHLSGISSVQTTPCCSTVASDFHKVLQLQRGSLTSMLTGSFSVFLEKETRLPTSRRWHDSFSNVTMDSPRTRMRMLFHPSPLLGNHYSGMYLTQIQNENIFLKWYALSPFPLFISFLEIHFWGDRIYWDTVSTVLLFIILTCTYIVQSFDTSVVPRTNLILEFL